MIVGDPELRAASECVIPTGTHSGKSLLEVPTSFLLWAMSTPGWRRSHAPLVEPALRELGRRLRTPRAVMREMDTPGPRRPPRYARSTQELLNPTPVQRLAAAKRKLARVTKRAESAHAAALLDEYRRRGLDLVE